MEWLPRSYSTHIFLLLFVSEYYIFFDMSKKMEIVIIHK